MNRCFMQPRQTGEVWALLGQDRQGLSAARELGRAGYDVTIYEAKAKGGGLNTYGIVSFRLPESIPCGKSSRWKRWE